MAEQFQPQKVVPIIFSWLLVSGALGIAVAIPSPHGMAAFMLSGIVLGVIGGIGHAIAYLIVGANNRQLSRSGSLSLGLMCGLITFPASTLFFEHSLFLPHDIYQVSLIVYLVVIGSVLGWLITNIVVNGKYNP